MNLFSNVGITELVLILLLALLVVGPERLPELARKLGKTLRDFRTAYDNLTKDLGPELMSIQETTRELRESVESVRSIPKDMVKQVVDAADLDDTIEQLKDVEARVGEVGATLSATGKAVRDPVGAAGNALRGSLSPQKPSESDASAGTEEALAVAPDDEMEQAEEDAALLQQEESPERGLRESEQAASYLVQETEGFPEPEPFAGDEVNGEEPEPGKDQAVQPAEAAELPVDAPAEEFGVVDVQDEALEGAVAVDQNPEPEREQTAVEIASIAMSSGSASRDDSGEQRAGEESRTGSGLQALEDEEPTEQDDE
jgi:sec-independent protein translocase protein TatB